MEYTRSIGDIYEWFEGTPKEIAELINELDKSDESLFLNRINTDPRSATEVDSAAVGGNRAISVLSAIVKGGE